MWPSYLYTCSGFVGYHMYSYSVDDSDTVIYLCVYIAYVVPQPVCWLTSSTRGCTSLIILYLIILSGLIKYLVAGVAMRYGTHILYSLEQRRLVTIATEDVERLVSGTSPDPNPREESRKNMPIYGYM